VNAAAYLNADRRSNILKYFADVFDNSRDSDLVIKVRERCIYVHKIILKIRSQIYFNNIVRFITSENNQDVIRLDQFSYTMYYAFFKYLYTGKIDLSLEEKFELLAMAIKLKELNLEKFCYETIKKEITFENVNFIRKMATKHGTAIVLNYCTELLRKYGIMT